MDNIVRRYNINLNVWEIGYWFYTRFIIIATTPAEKDLINGTR